MQQLTMFLRKKILISPNDRVLDSCSYVVLSVGFVVLCFVLDVILMLLSSKLLFGTSEIDINNVSNVGMALVSFCIPSTLCFSVVPIVVSKVFRKRSYQDIGLKVMKTKRSIVMKVICSLIFIGSLIKLFLKHDVSVAIMILVVFVFVGINEEILVRGVLFDILREKFKPFVAIIFASLIFVFILHSGSDFASNIIVRFPLSIILFYAYMFSGDIYSSIILHMSYNIVANSF